MKSRNKDFANLKADTEGLDAFAPPPSRDTTSHKKSIEDFSLVTSVWWHTLGQSRLRHTPFVAMYLLQQGRMNGWQPVKVSNIAVRAWNVDRWGKADALRELEELGLIRVWPGRGKRSPTAVFLVNG
jgi:hypothetical protein